MTGPSSVGLNTLRFASRPTRRRMAGSEPYRAAAPPQRPMAAKMGSLMQCRTPPLCLTDMRRHRRPFTSHKPPHTRHRRRCSIRTWSAASWTTYSDARPAMQQSGFRVQRSWVLPPQGDPRGVVHFLGGAFVGSAPDLTVWRTALFCSMHVSRHGEDHNSGDCMTDCIHASPASPVTRPWQLCDASPPHARHCKCSTRC